MIIILSIIVLLKFTFNGFALTVFSFAHRPFFFHVFINQNVNESSAMIMDFFSNLDQHIIRLFKEFFTFFFAFSTVVF